MFADIGIAMQKDESDQKRKVTRHKTRNGTTELCRVIVELSKKNRCIAAWLIVHKANRTSKIFSSTMTKLNVAGAFPE